MDLVLGEAPEDVAQRQQRGHVEAGERVAARQPPVLEAGEDDVEGLDEHPLLLPVVPDQLDPGQDRSARQPERLEELLGLLALLLVAPRGEVREVGDRVGPDVPLRRLPQLLVGPAAERQRVAPPPAAAPVEQLPERREGDEAVADVPLGGAVVRDQVDVDRVRRDDGERGLGELPGGPAAGRAHGPVEELERVPAGLEHLAAREREDEVGRPRGPALGVPGDGTLPPQDHPGEVALLLVGRHLDGDGLARRHHRCARLDGVRHDLSF